MHWELSTTFEFEASHTLTGYENPHSHFWVLEVCFRGQPQNGMIVDLVDLRRVVSAHIEKIQGTYLNDCTALASHLRPEPTSEALCEHFWGLVSKTAQEYRQKNPTVRLSSIAVTIFGEDRKALGQARIKE